MLAIFEDLFSKTTQKYFSLSDYKYSSLKIHWKPLCYTQCMLLIHSLIVIIGLMLSVSICHNVITSSGFHFRIQPKYPNSLLYHSIIVIIGFMLSVSLCHNVITLRGFHVRIQTKRSVE
jgi:hypothetical protein